MSKRRETTSAPTFERVLPWEENLGKTTLDRTVKVSKERQLFFQRNNEIPSPVSVSHIQDVGHAAIQLAKRVDGHKSKTKQQKISIQENESSDSASDEEFGSSMQRDELDQILMSEEWDTRFWNKVKIHEAINTLYGDIEKSLNRARRNLACKMLLHLNSIHREAYLTNENNLCTLSNRAFRKLTPKTKNHSIYNMAELLAVFATPYAAPLAHENAVLRALLFLMRQMDCAARILQHFRRRRQFERQISKQDITLEARMRVRAINVAKCIELNRQQRNINESLNREPMPEYAIISYMTIIAKLIQDELNPKQGFPRHDRGKIIPAGGLVWLTRCVQCHGEIQILATEVLTVLAYDKDRVCDILLSNVAIYIAKNLCLDDVPESYKRLALEFLDRAALSVCKMAFQQRNSTNFESHSSSSTKKTYHSLTRSLSTKGSRQPSALTTQGLLLRNNTTDDDDVNYRNRNLSSVVLERFMTPAIVTTLLSSLDTTPDLSIAILQVLHKVAYDIGYYLLIDLITRNAGRYLSSIVRCLGHENEDVVLSGLQVLMAITARDEGRDVITVAGLVHLVRPLCTPGFRKPGNSYRFVVGLLAIVLCANPVNIHLNFSNSQSQAYIPMTFNLSPPQILDHLHACLLHCVSHDINGDSAQYFLKTETIDLVLELLVQPLGQNMQTRYQRHVSSIFIAGLCRITKISSLISFNESVAAHLAIVIQQNRTEESEGCVSTSAEAKRHLQSTADACQSFIRILRCQKQTNQPPELYLSNQSFILRILLKLHALDDIVASCRPVDSVSDFVLEDTHVVKNAIQLVGMLCLVPLPNHLHRQSTHAHGITIDLVIIQELDTRLIKASVIPLLNTLAAAEGMSKVIKWCCCTLAQFCCMNSTCSLVLEYRCMDIIASLIPNVPSNTLSSGSDQAVHIGSSVEDDKLIALPSAFYTLLAKLCRVPDGRAAILRLNVLPRILKRIHLAAHGKSLSPLHDNQCRSEIALLIAILANDNVVSVGNVNEMFLRHQVHLVLVQMLDVRDAPPDLLLSLHENGIKAMSAFAKDHVRCVPPLAAAGAIPRVADVLSRWDHDTSVTMDMLEGAVQIMWGMTQSTSSAIQDAIKKTKVSEDLLRIGCSFQLEMLKYPSMGSKSIGEVAREALRYMSDFESKQKRSQAPLANSPPKPIPSSPQSRLGYSNQMTTYPIRRHTVNETSDDLKELPNLDLHPSKLPNSPSKKVKNESSLPSLQVDWKSTRPPGPKPEATMPTMLFVRPKASDERRKYPQMMLDPLFGALEHGIDPCLAKKCSPKSSNNEYVPQSSSIMGHFVTIESNKNEREVVMKSISSIKGSMSTGKIKTIKKS